MRHSWQDLALRWRLGLLSPQDISVRASEAWNEGWDHWSLGALVGPFSNTVTGASLASHLETALAHYGVRIPSLAEAIATVRKMPFHSEEGRDLLGAVIGFRSQRAQGIDWWHPWFPVPNDTESFYARRLVKEIGPGHPLFGVPRVLIGGRSQSEVVLCRTQETVPRIAEVHLTFGDETPERPSLPHTLFHPSLEHWARERMYPEMRAALERRLEQIESSVPNPI